MTRYYLAYIFTVFLILQVSCKNPEDTASQDNSASEHTMDSDGISDSMPQDPTSLRPSQMDESTGALKDSFETLTAIPLVKPLYKLTDQHWELQQRQMDLTYYIEFRPVRTD